LIYRQLGKTGLSVSVVGLGCSHLGAQRRGRTRAEFVRLLEHAVERGITFFDTADVYMAGESERLLGAVLAPHRDRVIVATKVGFRQLVPEAVLARVRPYLSSITGRGGAGKPVLRGVRNWLRRADYSADHLHTAVEASLTRLRTDRIDVLQLHRPTLAVLEQDGALETVDRLVTQGKVRFYGLAFATCTKARNTLRDGGLSTLQLPVSIAAPAAADDILGWARQRGIGVVANQPLGGGELARGPHAGGVSDGPRLAQAAIRFAASRPGVSTVVVGTTNLRHLDENVAALDGPPLTVPDAVGAERTAGR
jgi:aryl-alcohol dehydrogenase-like predicted oxidoreductase